MNRTGSVRYKIEAVRAEVVELEEVVRRSSGSGRCRRRGQDEKRREWGMMMGVGKSKSRSKRRGEGQEGAKRGKVNGR